MKRKMKKILREAPKIPFGRITDEQKDEIRSYFASHDINTTGIPDEYWMQTQDQARGIIERVRRGGFIVGGELEHGNCMDGYGVHAHIYSREHQGDVSEHCEYKQVIGQVKLWDSWGFFKHPTTIWYQEPNTIQEALELRKHLEENNIPFEDSIHEHSLRRRMKQEEENFETTKTNVQKILTKAPELELRLTI